MNQELVLLTLSEWDSFPKLPVCLTIKLVCLDENVAGRFRGLEQDKVGWDALTLTDFQDLSNLDVCAGNGHDTANTLLLALQHSILSTVKLLVTPVAIKVINAFFDHRHDQYEGKRSDVSEEEANFEEWDELTNCDNQEEHVEEELELIIEHLEEEGESIVLLIIKAVTDEMARYCRALNSELSLFLGYHPIKVAFEGVPAAKGLHLKIFIILHISWKTREISDICTLLKYFHYLTLLRRGSWVSLLCCKV